MKNFILFALLFYSLQSFSQTHNYHAFDGISFIAGGTVYKTQLFSDRFVINDTTYYGQQNFWGRITGSTNDIYNINSGNIGINTTQPLEYKLEVNGNVKISTGQEMSQFASIDSNGTYLSNSYSGSTFSPPDKSPIASATLPSTTYYRSGRLVADYSQSTLQYKNYRLGGINNNSWTITGIYVTEQSDEKKFTGRILNNLYDGDDPDEGLYVGLGTESLPFGKTYTRKLWLQNPTVVGNSDRIRLLVQDNDTKETHTMNVSDIVVPESLWSRVSGSTNNIYSLNSENIGIGTTNPLYSLDVKSADPIVARFFNDANTNGIGFVLVEDELSSGYNAPIGSLGIDGDGSLRVKYKLDSQFSGERAWGKILYANIYGNVSIGADSAKALLHINSKASSTHPFFISNNPGSGIDTTMVFSSAGRLGIGIGLTNPSATIQGQSSTGPATSLLLSTYPAQTGTLSQTLAQSDLRHINAQTCYARNTLIWNQLTSHYEYKQTVANTGGTLNYLYIDITTGASRMATGFTSLDFQNSGNTSFSGAGDFAIGTNVFSGHYPLQITMDAANHGSVSPIGITSYNGSQTITTLSAGGTKAAPTALADMFTMAGIGSRGWDGSAWSTNRAGLNITTDGAWTTTSHGTQTIFKHTAPGSTANPTERLRITSVGVGVLTTETPTAALDVNSDRIRLRTAKTPATAASTGYTGDICWDASYIYVCIATNTWKRSAISTW